MTRNSATEEDKIIGILYTAFHDEMIAGLVGIDGLHITVKETAEGPFMHHSAKNAETILYGSDIDGDGSFDGRESHTVVNFEE